MRVMPKTAIITDTDASLPLELAQKHHINQVPIMVNFGEESFRAVYDINDAETFAKIDKTNKLPTTSAPSPGQFLEAYKDALAQGYDSIICITVSSGISATFSAAQNAAALLPDEDITIIDSKSLSMGQGMMVLTAAEVLAKSGTKENAIAAAESVRERTHLFAALSTLKYLAMSGRVGHLAASIANLLNVKPILSIRNGRLEMLEKVRTQKKAWERTIDLTVEKAAGSPIEKMSIIHVDALDDAKRLEALLRNFLPCPDEITYAELTPGLSVHSGAGLVGVVSLIRE
jgi:DegV family protein with EDD domain